MSFLVLRQLEKRYPDGFLAVKGIDLIAKEGECIVLLGPSGCGKTTTLRCVAGLEIATAGSISLAGKDVTTARPSQRDVGMVFQFYALYPHLSVRENILFPLKSMGVAKAEREQRLHAVCERLHLEPLLNRSPRQLSGGDQQRISLARAMIRKPKLWLMDEPLGTIDGEARESLRDFVREQQLEQGVTTLYVTHDQEEAMTLADRVVVMKDGLMCQIGTPEDIYEHPADLFVAEFVGSPGMNRLSGTVIEQGFHLSDSTVVVPLPTASVPGPAILGIRGEYIHLDDQADLRGVVVLDEYLGGWRNIHVDGPGGRMVVRSTDPHRLAPGTPVGLRIDHQHVCLFSAATGQRLS